MTRHSLSYFCTVAVVAAAAALMHGCSSSRQAASSAPDTTAPTAVSAKTLTRVMADSYAGWQDFYAPFKLRLESPVKFSFSGRATMVRDRYIHLSLRVFGMEAAIVYADNENAYLFDKLHKYVCTVALSSLTARTGITLADLQQMMMGQAFYPGVADFASAPLNVAADCDSWTLTPRSSSTVKWILTADSDARLTSLTVAPEGYGEFVATFSDFLTTVAGACASAIDLSGELHQKALKASVDWDFGKAQWNKGRDSKMSLPDGYQAITPAQLIQILKQF